LRKKGYGTEIINEIKKEKSSLSKLKDIEIYNISSHGVKSLLEIRKKVKEIERDGKINVFDIHHYAYALPFIFEKRNIVLSLHFYELTCPFMGFPQKIMSDHFTLDPSNEYFSFNKCVLTKKCVSCWHYFKWRLMRSYVLRKVNKIVVKKNYLKELLQKNGVDSKKIYIIPYWIDADKIYSGSNSKEIKQKLTEFNDSEVTFSFVGRLDPAKGPFLVLKAFKIIDKQLPDSKLLYLGDGPLLSSLRTFVKENKLRDRVIFTGRISHDEIVKYYSIPNIFIHAQRYSNYGWALLETMATKKPIIATDVGETSDILIDGFNALLSKPNPESLAMKMIELASNHRLASEIAVNALLTLKDKHGKRNLERYEMLLNRQSYSH